MLATYLYADSGPRKDVADSVAGLEMHGARGLEKVHAVVGRGDIERSGQFSWARQQIAFAARFRTPLPHVIQARKRVSGPNQHGGCRPFMVGRHIEHPMYAVIEVDICATRRAKHHSIAIRDAPMSVASRIVWSAICLHFHNSGATSTPNQRQAEKRPCALQYIRFQCGKGVIKGFKRHWIGSGGK